MRDTSDDPLPGEGEPVASGDAADELRPASRLDAGYDADPVRAGSGSTPPDDRDAKDAAAEEEPPG